MGDEGVAMSTVGTMDVIWTAALGAIGVAFILAVIVPSWPARRG
jgi:hypothetical protein